jgi:transcriptional regulator with XRE-family HTH domain
MTVGRNIRVAREARHMTQKDVGDVLGVTNRDVSRWENGKVEPGPLYRQLLADELFDGDVARLYEMEGTAA